MKVSELIAALSHYDPNLEVVDSIWDSYGTDHLSHVGNCLVLDRPNRSSVPEPAKTDKPTAEVRPVDTLQVSTGNPPQPGPFEEGTLVCMKTGGPLMTVEDVRSDGCVGTVWFSDGKLYRDAFHPSHLNVLVLA